MKDIIENCPTCTGEVVMDLPVQKCPHCGELHVVACHGCTAWHNEEPERCIACSMGSNFEEHE